jgi:hypothetical protein
MLLSVVGHLNNQPSVGGQKQDSEFDVAYLYLKRERPEEKSRFPFGL